jgi:hypothetical protein
MLAGHVKTVMRAFWSVRRNPMYVSEVFRASAFSLGLPESLVRRFRAQIWSVFFPATNLDRAQMLHDVLQLDVVSALGETPAAYGWRVDALLNVRLESAGAPRQPAPEPPNLHDPSPPEPGVPARIYRVPRTQRRPKLQLLTGGLAQDVA